MYLLHADLAPAVAAWSAAHPERPVHVFWDRTDVPDTLAATPSLTYHRLNGPRFLDLMARCHALACTAGFESVCEAMYLGKPVLMLPVRGHFEQHGNARDAEAAGAGLHRPTFDLDALLAHAPPPVPGFRAWADSAEAVIVREIERAAGFARPRATRPPSLDGAATPPPTRRTRRRAGHGSGIAGRPVRARAG